nr:TPA_asm: hypothetical protein HUJ06_016491 [Nelumbo nucifera]
MLTGLRALDTNRPSGQHNLVEWLKPSLHDKRKLKTMIDSRLEGQFPMKGAVQLAQLTLSCLGSEPKSRPSMKEVVETLERIEAIKDNKPKESRTNSAQPRGYRHGQSPLHHRSPLHPRQEGGRVGDHAYQQPPRRG